MCERFVTFQGHMTAVYLHVTVCHMSCPGNAFNSYVFVAVYVVAKALVATLDAAASKVPQASDAGCFVHATVT